MYLHGAFGRTLRSAGLPALPGGVAGEETPQRAPRTPGCGSPAALPGDSAGKVELHPMASFLAGLHDHGRSLGPTFGMVGILLLYSGTSQNFLCVSQVFSGNSALFVKGLEAQRPLAKTTNPKERPEPTQGKATVRARLETKPPRRPRLLRLIFIDPSNHSIQSLRPALAPT